MSLENGSFKDKRSYKAMVRALDFVQQGAEDSKRYLAMFSEPTGP